MQVPSYGRVEFFFTMAGLMGASWECACPVLCGIRERLQSCSLGNPFEGTTEICTRAVAWHKVKAFGSNHVCDMDRIERHSWASVDCPICLVQNCMSVLCK